MPKRHQPDTCYSILYSIPHQEQTNLVYIVATMEAPMQQIRDLYANASATEKHKIQEQLRDLKNDLDTDWEVLFSLAMGVSIVIYFGMFGF